MSNQSSTDKSDRPSLTLPAAFASMAARQSLLTDRHFIASCGTHLIAYIVVRSQHSLFVHCAVASE